jgi:hypothetical protein
VTAVDIDPGRSNRRVARHLCWQDDIDPAAEQSNLRDRPECTHMPLSV